RVSAWGDALGAKARRFYDLRIPFLRDLARQTAFQETATGLGGLAVIAAGAWLAHPGRMGAAGPPLLALRARSARARVRSVVGDRPSRPPARRHARRRPAAQRRRGGADPGERRTGCSGRAGSRAPPRAGWRPRGCL